MDKDSDSNNNPRPNDYYSTTITTDQNNRMKLNIEIINSELSISCTYEKNFIKNTFSNLFSLEILQEQPIFSSFNTVEQILYEIINKKTKEKEYIIGNELISDSIELVIPMPLNVNNKMSFILNKEVKTVNQSLNEHIIALNKYVYQFEIKDFNSNILLGSKIQKDAIKSWISSFKRIEAELLYSFHSISYIDDKNKEIIHNPGFYQKPSDFHRVCDFKRNLLIICKSKNEIFGGYTPLFFDNSDGYKKDNESFLFSLNRQKKYEKNLVIFLILFFIIKTMVLAFVKIYILLKIQ